MRRVKTSAGKNSYHWDYQELLFLVHVLNQKSQFKDMLNLFLDLHTHQEIAEIIRRVIIASMLNNGQTYDEICELTGASSATISKVHQKFYRQKSVLNDALQKAGEFEKFMTTNPDLRDQLTKFIDRAFYKKSLGLLGKK